MTYREALARVLALRGGEQAGMAPGLERIETLLDALGRPEQRYEIVQVGGTNGKGSVASLLATMLKAAGRRTGLYTSPHLCSFRERIRVDGAPISEDAVADGVEALGTLVVRTNATMFEATTALALDHFAAAGVDVAVLEVGLGGRLDATTVGWPRATVITRIDLDHQAVLGTTLEAIAREKAAIIRSPPDGARAPHRGVAISAAQPPDVARVIADRARATAVPLLVEGAELHVVVSRASLDGQLVSFRGPDFELAHARLAMLGRFQASNALLAVSAARRLGVPEAAIRAGLARTEWPGRFQVFRDEPILVIDGAHNPGGARALAGALIEYFGATPITLILGIAADKDAAGILAALAPVARRVILTRSSHPRAADPTALQRAMPPGLDAELAASAREALAAATAPPRPSVVCVAGSLFLVGDVLTLRSGRPDSPCRIEKEAASINARL
jgi:dihydrofolate synthase/folylpolyglutamate synthase